VRHRVRAVRGDDKGIFVATHADSETCTVIVALIVIVAAGGAALAAHSFTRRAGHDVMAAFGG
jgi:hypothetical protein